MTTERDIKIELYGKVKHRSFAMYEIIGANDPIQYINHLFSRRKAIRKLVAHGLHFNDILHVKGSPETQEEVNRFIDALRTYLKKKNLLNLHIHGDPKPDNALELERQISYQQKNILNTTKNIIVSIDSFLWQKVLDVNPSDIHLEPKKIIEKIQNAKIRLRAIQIFSSFICLIGSLGFTIMMAIALATKFTQIFIALLVVLAIVALLSLSVLIGVSLFGMKRGIFKNAEHTKKLSRDFLEMSSDSDG